MVANQPPGAVDILGLCELGEKRDCFSGRPVMDSNDQFGLNEMDDQLEQVMELIHKLAGGGAVSDGISAAGGLHHGAHAAAEGINAAIDHANAEGADRVLHDLHKEVERTKRGIAANGIVYKVPVRWKECVHGFLCWNKWEEKSIMVGPIKQQTERKPGVWRQPEPFPSGRPASGKELQEMQHKVRIQYCGK